MNQGNEYLNRYKAMISQQNQNSTANGIANKTANTTVNNVATSR
jgi:hypothetical protein